jgi:hypothetical protein
MSEEIRPIAKKRPLALVAEFAGPDRAASAARSLRARGFTQMEAYGPFPAPELAEAIGFREHKIAPWMLAGGTAGALGGFGLQVYMTAIDYPHNIGGRPLFSWPAFIPVTFECTIIGAALCGIGALIVLSGLPRLAHPIFSAAHFERASSDHFFLAVAEGGAGRSFAQARLVLEEFEPVSISEIQAEDEA